MKFIIDVWTGQDIIYLTLMIKNSRIQNSILTDRLMLEKLKVDDYDFILSLVNTTGWIENIGDRNIHSKNEAIEYI